VIALSWITSSFGKLFGAKPVGRSLVSEEEIRAMISAGSKDGTVEEAEAEMLHKVLSSVIALPEKSWYPAQKWSGWKRNKNHRFFSDLH
jgi:hypothetical protein